MCSCLKPWVRSTVLTANPHWMSSILVLCPWKLTIGRWLLPWIWVITMIVWGWLWQDKSILGIAGRLWRVSQEKEEMRGQRDGMFAARKQLRECVGNVEEGSLVKNEGAEAYLKPLWYKHSSGRLVQYCLFTYHRFPLWSRQAPLTCMHFLILQVSIIPSIFFHPSHPFLTNSWSSSS